MAKYLVVKMHKKGSKIYMYLRGEDRSKKLIEITDFRPYFYVPDPLGRYQAIDGEYVDKVYVNSPEEVPRERAKYPKHYEADIPYLRRFLIDTNIYKCIEIEDGKESYSYKELKPIDCNIKPRMINLDIEVYAINEFPQHENPIHPIITITVYEYDSDEYKTWLYHPALKTLKKKMKVRFTAGGREYVVVNELRLFKDEISMLDDFLEYFKAYNPDIILGWNVFFDVKYLSARLKKLGREFPRVFDILDVYRGYKYLMKEVRDLRLKAVSVYEGFEYPEEVREASEVIPMWKQKPLEVMKYNLKDVWRVVMIDKKRKVSDYYLAIKWVVGIESITSFLTDEAPYNREYLTKVLIDTFLLRVAREVGVVLPSQKPVPKLKTKKYKGGTVFEPIPGVHEGVAVFDMSRYYPSIIISFNISPETKVKKNGKVFFRRDKEGILPIMAKRLLKLREELEEYRSKLDPNSPEFESIENKIAAVKGLINAIYGTTGTERFRLFDIDVASTITAIAREGIEYVASVSEKMGYKVIYGDTDSIFIKVPFGKAKELAEILTKKVRLYFMQKYGLDEEPVLKLKFEKYYKRLFFKEAKKRYAGILVWKKGKEINKLDIVGFEGKKRNYPPITAEMEKELFEYILSTDNPDPMKINAIIKKYADEMKKRRFDDIAYYYKPNKDLSQYKSETFYIKAIHYSNAVLGLNIRSGQVAKILFVKETRGIPYSRYIAYIDESQIKDKVVVDYEAQANKVLVEPANIILEALGMKASKRVYHDITSFF